jgi:hypothetical protein
MLTKTKQISASRPTSLRPPADGSTKLLPFTALQVRATSRPATGALIAEGAPPGIAGRLNGAVDVTGVQEHLRDAAQRLDDARARNNVAAKHLRVTVTGTPRRAPAAGTPPNAGRAALNAAAAAKRAKAAPQDIDSPPVEPEPAPPTATPPAPEAALSPLALQGFQLLQRTFAANPKLVVSLADAVVSDLPTEKIPQPLLEKVGSIANDVATEVAQAQARIRQFLADLAQIQLDLNEENVRHSQAMLAVGAYEARRWSLIGELNDQYVDVFQKTSSKAGDTFNDPNSVPLFRYASTKAWLDQSFAAAQAKPYDVPKADADATENAIKAESLQNHPQIFLEEGVFTSVRKLAETTRAWQAAPQRTADPTGWNIAASNVRLHKAISTIDGHLLMLSLNENLAADNVVRLDSEIAEHDMQIDGISARAREAGYRLALGDLKAYHASGITEDDIRVLETALLAWIGVGVQ